MGQRGHLTCPSDQMNLWALGEFGPPARSALPVISNFVNDPDSRIREAAKEAIKKVTGTATDSPLPAFPLSAPP